ncbi:hypothetical protein CYMTET_10219 [Cymbomonas tetramitiformis]|uniref:F-box domain-containing protein n=1 Tax=Cymbomonas tetramitiformis TaxID=36881 RepID=A0AAE0GPM2_9CHLO|nr:hypothetical protein CYMTET_10219 [Cymbomonas tetramitiformis]
MALSPVWNGLKRTSNTQCSIDVLPVELLEEIILESKKDCGATVLSLKDVGYAACVSRKWREALGSCAPAKVVLRRKHDTCFYKLECDLLWRHRSICRALKGIEAAGSNAAPLAELVEERLHEDELYHSGQVRQHARNALEAIGSEAS